MAYALVRKMKDGTIKAYGASAGMSPWHQDLTRIWKIKSEDKAHTKRVHAECLCCAIRRSREP
ncbi:hypothetical protein [Stenotrophomonas phage CM2]